MECNFLLGFFIGVGVAAVAIVFDDLKFYRIIFRGKQCDTTAKV